MDILEQIDKLEAMASQAKRMPITGAAMIDGERLVSLIDQMRLAVPRNVQEAQEVLERREQIINQTMLDARRIRAVAETDARTLVDESELVKSAKKRGDEIVAEAEQKALRMIAQTEQYIRGKQAGADEYAQESLAGLEEQVLNILNVIHAGQRILTPAEDALSAADLTYALQADKAS
jgi:vacuolar-type H+-ATPase subunit H